MTTPDLKKLKLAVAKHINRSVFENMAVKTQTILAMIDRIKKLEKVAKISTPFKDMPCYCDDAVLNNRTGICTPCELSIALNELEVSE